MKCRFNVKFGAIIILLASQVYQEIFKNSLLILLFISLDEGIPFLYDLNQSPRNTVHNLYQNNVLYEI